MKEINTRIVVDGEFVNQEEKHYTVFKTSLFFANDGFTVYDCSNSELVFRVDSYGPDASNIDELILMDPHGRCILTVRKKRPSLHHRWEGFLGERKEGQKAMFSVRRSSIIGPSGTSVQVYDNPGEEYEIEGSYGSRSCSVIDSARREVVAEIRRKVDASTNMVLGRDVFALAVKAGFDGAFAMGLVLVLDQICGGDVVEDDGDCYGNAAVDVDHVGHEEEVDSGPIVVDSTAFDR